MNYLFSGCSSLKSIPDISKWNTSNVINMKGMFEECSSLKSIPDITKWNTSNVKNMKYMFKNCSSLKSLPDISKWDIDNCLKYKKIYEMFNGCSKPLNIPDNLKIQKNVVILEVALRLNSTIWVVPILNLIKKMINLIIS